jgi:hypothetical protein
VFRGDISTEAGTQHGRDMDNWKAEPFYVWWDAQMAVIAQEQANAQAPTPSLAAAAEQELRQWLQKGQRASYQGNLGALRHGAKDWKRRR